MLWIYKLSLGLINQWSSWIIWIVDQPLCLHGNFPGIVNKKNYSFMTWKENFGFLDRLPRNLTNNAWLGRCAQFKVSEWEEGTWSDETVLEWKALKIRLSDQMEDGRQSNFTNSMPLASRLDRLNFIVSFSPHFFLLNFS